MNGFATVQVGGNLTRDPELRQTKDGTSVANFGLAVNRRGKNGERVSFFDIDCWRGLAELVVDWKKKGDAVIVTGELEQNTYEDRNGDKKSKVTITARDVIFLGGGNSEGEGSSSNGSRVRDGQKAASAAKGGARRAQQTIEEDYEDIPF